MLLMSSTTTNEASSPASTCAMVARNLLDELYWANQTVQTTTPSFDLQCFANTVTELFKCLLVQMQRSPHSYFAVGDANPPHQESMEFCSTILHLLQTLLLHMPTPKRRVIQDTAFATSTATRNSRPLYSWVANQMKIAFGGTYRMQQLQEQDHHHLQQQQVSNKPATMSLYESVANMMRISFTTTSTSSTATHALYDSVALKMGISFPVLTNARIASLNKMEQVPLYRKVSSNATTPTNEMLPMYPSVANIMKVSFSPATSSAKMVTSTQRESRPLYPPVAVIMKISFPTPTSQQIIPIQDKFLPLHSSSVSKTMKISFPTAGAASVTCSRAVSSQDEFLPMYASVAERMNISFAVTSSSPSKSVAIQDESIPMYLTVAKIMKFSFPTETPPSSKAILTGDKILPMYASGAGIPKVSYSVTTQDGSLPLYASVSKIMNICFAAAKSLCRPMSTQDDLPAYPSVAMIMKIGFTGLSLQQNASNGDQALPLYPSVAGIMKIFFVGSSASIARDNALPMYPPVAKIMKISFSTWSPPLVATSDQVEELPLYETVAQIMGISFAEFAATTIREYLPVPRVAESLANTYTSMTPNELPLYPAVARCMKIAFLEPSFSSALNDLPLYPYVAQVMKISLHGLTPIFDSVDRSNNNDDDNDDDNDELPLYRSVAEIMNISFLNLYTPPSKSDELPLYFSVAKTMKISFVTYPSTLIPEALAIDRSTAASLLRVDDCPLYPSVANSMKISFESFVSVLNDSPQTKFPVYPSVGNMMKMTFAAKPSSIPTTWDKWPVYQSVATIMKMSFFKVSTTPAPVVRENPMLSPVLAIPGRMNAVHEGFPWTMDKYEGPLYPSVAKIMKISFTWSFDKFVPMGTLPLYPSVSKIMKISFANSVDCSTSHTWPMYPSVAQMMNIQFASSRSPATTTTRDAGKQFMEWPLYPSVAMMMNIVCGPPGSSSTIRITTPVQPSLVDFVLNRLIPEELLKEAKDVDNGTYEQIMVRLVDCSTTLQHGRQMLLPRLLVEKLMRLIPSEEYHLNKEWTPDPTEGQHIHFAVQEDPILAILVATKEDPILGSSMAEAENGMDNAEISQFKELNHSSTPTLSVLDAERNVEYANASLEGERTAILSCDENSNERMGISTILQMAQEEAVHSVQKKDVESSQADVADAKNPDETVSDKKEPTVVDAEGQQEAKDRVPEMPRSIGVSSPPPLVSVVSRRNFSVGLVKPEAQKEIARLAASEDLSEARGRAAEGQVIQPRTQTIQTSQIPVSTPPIRSMAPSPSVKAKSISPPIRTNVSPLPSPKVVSPAVTSKHVPVAVAAPSTASAPSSERRTTTTTTTTTPQQKDLQPKSRIASSPQPKRGSVKLFREAWETRTVRESIVKTDPPNRSLPKATNSESNTPVIGAPAISKSRSKEDEWVQIEKGDVKTEVLSLSATSSSSSASASPETVSNIRTQDALGDRGIYTGTVSRGTLIPNGYGEMKYTSGRFYKGQWVAGHWEGKGQVGNAAGDVYEGTLFKDKRNGFGILKFADGRVFEGEFKNDKMFEGSLSFPDQSRYEGMFRNGKRNGIGVNTYADGSRYEGEVRFFLSCIAMGVGSVKKAVA